MIPFERHQEIMDLLEKHHSLTIRYLSHALHTSEATLRRDLATLEKQRLIKRVFGGAVLATYSAMHLPLSARQQEQKLAKAQIAAKALEHVSHGSVIMLDGSSTVQLMVPQLEKFQNLTIISNSGNVCRMLSDTDVQVYCIGGEMHPRDGANYGSYAERMVSQMHAEIFCFSCGGLSADGELTGYYERGVSFLRAALPRAARRIFLCDSTKFGKVFPHHLCTVEDVDAILCDKPLPEEIMERIGRNRPSAVLS